MTHPLVQPMHLAEPTVQLADLALNERDEHGVEWWLADLEDWDSPASSTEATQRSGDHGAWLNPGHLTARQLVLTGHTHAATPRACRDAETRLAAAVGLDDVQLVVHEHGLSRYVIARRSGAVLWDYLDAATATWSISLIAGDPRRYSLTPHHEVVRLTAITGGLTAPAHAPVTVSATVTPNFARLVNAGNTAAAPVFAIHGPVSDPALVLQGHAMRFGLDLAPGQVLLVDVAARTVELAGGPTRRHTMTGPWLTLPPGNSTVTFLAASYDPASRVEVAWNDTWT